MVLCTDLFPKAPANPIVAVTNYGNSNPDIGTFERIFLSESFKVYPFLLFPFVMIIGRWQSI